MAFIVWRERERDWREKVETMRHVEEIGFFIVWRERERLARKGGNDETCGGDRVFRAHNQKKEEK